MADNQELKEIIRKIKFLKGLSQKEIAAELDSSATYLSDMIHGRVPFSDEFRSNINKVFPDCIPEDNSNTATINAPNHGLIAVGNHTTNTLNTTTPATETEDITEAEVAVIPTELYKDPNTNLYQYTEVNDVETQPIVHQFSPHDRFYRVINSSMSPKLLASDVVALQRVDINDSIPGCVYMIDHRTKGSFLRKVTDQGDTLLLTSYNKEDYPDFIVYKKDVLNLARVVGLIRTDI